MKAISVSLILNLLGCAVLIAQPVSGHAQKAVETIQQLRAIGFPNPYNSFDVVEAGPPAKVPGLLRELNQELKALIVEDLNDHTRLAGPSEDEIREQLIAAGWEEIPRHKWNAYGEIRQIKFDWKPEYEPGVLIVSTQLWVPCDRVAADSAIYVFQEMGRKWNLVLATESDFESTDKRDEDGLQYQISPPDSKGNWFLAMAHMPPTCPGPLNGSPTLLRYKVLRPGANAEQPTVLLAGRQRLNPFFEPAFRIRAEEDWFALTQGRVRKLDGEPGIAVLRYEVADNRVQRIAPLALTPEDFLDQWVQMTWDDAKRWSNPGLQDWHSLLEGLAPDSTQIEAVQRCSVTDQDDQDWLIELAVDQRPNPSVRSENLFVKVAKRKGVFHLDGILNNHLAGCSGKTRQTLITDNNLPDW